VARLTLTSKPKAQATAWQASAEGRDMAVSIQPAAHPDGTTIEVLDLFFNTPARRKFLRTEKTEFNHIDEVIRRIALACFDVSFSLTHNGKIIRQYRAAMTKAQSAKRVAMVCGQKFVEHAVEVQCQHDDMLFSGWLAKPSFARNQNDLWYRDVNGRMMRDKLINHAIRQAYADLLPADTYPAFVLFLTLDHREVDVNVHPAKHEVRFHQSRYVHDFIYSVCHKALMENNPFLDFQEELQPVEKQVESTHESVQYERPDYVKPLTSMSPQQINEKAYSQRSATTNSYTANPGITKSAVENYQKLMTPIVHNEREPNDKLADVDISNALTVPKVQPHVETFFLAIEQGQFGIFKQDSRLRLLSLTALAYQLHKNKILLHWQLSETKPNKGLISQPLLLPVVIKLSENQMRAVQDYQAELALAGIVVTIKNK
jgi:DNA mismatch repair protein MutL